MKLLLRKSTMYQNVILKNTTTTTLAYVKQESIETDRWHGRRFTVAASLCTG